MLEIRQIKLSVQKDETQLNNTVSKILNIKSLKFSGNTNYKMTILKKSLDARKKPDLYYIYTVGIQFEDDRLEEIIISNNNRKKSRDRADLVISEPVNYSYKADELTVKEIINNKKYKRPVITGFGPAGIFSAYILALNGFNPIILERGEDVDSRQKTIDSYLNGGALNTESNIQFGEGGAGTFSDGKLNTLTKDKYGRQRFVLETFVKFGAQNNILFDSKPHIGTDVLALVVKKIRKEIIRLGGKFYFNTKLNYIDTEDGHICGIRTVSTGNKNTIDSMIMDTDHLVLAIGHSARDTFEILRDMNLPMEPKSFAVGFRVEHPQTMINDSQYGTGYPECMEAAAYKVANTASNGRRVYSFCMCPGGHVVNASSENNRICVNGMSYSKRDSEYANSAIIIGVDPVDFKAGCLTFSDDPLAGMYYQRSLEEKAFTLGKGCVPYQSFWDFEKSFMSKSEGEVNDFSVTSHDKNENKSLSLGILGKCSPADLTDILEADMNSAFIESMHRFGHQIEGFDSRKTILYGVESRTSSPVRILRDDNFKSEITGIYPCGEGAGYAGGIMSAAVDGIKVAEAVISDYLANNN